MQFKDKNIIHSCRDAEGDMHVVDTAEGVRVLYFGQDVQQSRMQLSDPNALITPYEQVMACWQLFDINIKQVLVLGLGAGSATKYCFEHLPAAQLHVVELRESVLTIAREYFSLPIDMRLTAYIEDGIHFVKHQLRHTVNKLDLMLIDLFDLKDNYTYTYDAAFLTACLACLSENGVLAINIWANNPERFKAVMANIGEVFQWKLLMVPVPYSGNLIVFAFHPDGKKQSYAAMQARAKALAADTRHSAIAWQAHLASMIKHNQNQLDLILEPND